MNVVNVEYSKALALLEELQQMVCFVLHNWVPTHHQSYTDSDHGECNQYRRNHFGGCSFATYCPLRGKWPDLSFGIEENVDRADTSGSALRNGSERFHTATR